MAEACGGPDEMNIGAVTAADGSWTILNGRVPEGALKVAVTDAKGATVEVPTVADGKGVAGRFVVKKVEGVVERPTFEALGSDGRTLATKRLGD